LKVERLWSTNTGPGGKNRSSPTSARIYEGGRLWVGDHRGQVIAVNADSGRVERRFDTGLELSAGPAVQDGLILLGTFDGRLVVLDAESGERRWTARLSSEVLSYPVLHDGVSRCALH
jgi:outer membrane protein assembly factor BamB